MKTIMTRAWEIAKAGAERFGGSAREYLSKALKMAWVLEGAKARYAINKNKYVNGISKEEINSLSNELAEKWAKRHDQYTNEELYKLALTHQNFMCKYEVVEVLYSEYKSDFCNCGEALKDTYNAEKKTIKVYMTKLQQAELKLKTKFRCAARYIEKFFVDEKNDTRYNLNEMMEII